MKKMKKFLALALIGTMCMGTALTANAAELDTAWYAAKNPDVVAVMGNSPEAMKLHYEVFGKYEHRMANPNDIEAQLRRLFNAKEYAALYPDVKAVFGDNEEAMFNHYITYGLLERRRPSEKVSQDTAVTLRNAVAEALTSAGLDATPGSGQLAAIITDTIPATAAAQAVQAAMKQTQPTIEKAVEAAAAPAPAGGSGGGSSSSGSSGSASKPSDSSSGDVQDTDKKYMITGIESSLADGIAVSISAEEFVAYANISDESYDATALKEKVAGLAVAELEKVITIKGYEVVEEDTSDNSGEEGEITDSSITPEEPKTPESTEIPFPTDCWKVQPVASAQENRAVSLHDVPDDCGQGESPVWIMFNIVIDEAKLAAAGYTVSEEAKALDLYKYVTTSNPQLQVYANAGLTMNSLSQKMTVGNNFNLLTFTGGASISKKVVTTVYDDPEDKENKGWKLYYNQV